MMVLPPCGEFVGQSLLACSRSSNFWILPVEVLGSGPNTTVRGALKRASSLAAVLDQLLGRGGGALAQRDEGARALAPLLVGPGDHGGLQHGRMTVEGALDLDRADVLAAGDDDVLRAVLDLDIAVGVHHREVAGVEPAAGEGLARWRSGS